MKFHLGPLRGFPEDSGHVFRLLPHPRRHDGEALLERTGQFSQRRIQPRYFLLALPNPVAKARGRLPILNRVDQALEPFVDSGPIRPGLLEELRLFTDLSTAI